MLNNNKGTVNNANGPNELIKVAPAGINSYVPHPASYEDALKFKPSKKLVPLNVLQNPIHGNYGKD